MLATEELFGLGKNRKQESAAILTLSRFIMIGLRNQYSNNIDLSKEKKVMDRMKEDSDAAIANAASEVIKAWGHLISAEIRYYEFRHYVLKKTEPQETKKAGDKAIAEYAAGVKRAERLLESNGFDAFQNDSTRGYYADWSGLSVSSTATMLTSYAA